jgi:predicted AlkP superfamily pyrophosphatase or phosphodiesterase
LVDTFDIGVHGGASMRRLVVVLSLLACWGVHSGLAAEPPAPQAASPRTPAARAGQPAAPKLLVILVVDQFRADYVARFSRDWTGGLRRLLAEGAVFTQAAYPYLATVTCVGHSTIATGSLPRTHGIVSNTLYDRATGRAENCVADPETTPVSYGTPVKGTATSTRKLLVPTLPDELRAQRSAAPRVVTMSLKDYTATTMAGRRADAALWLNAEARTLVTSSAFAKEPAPWVAEFLKANGPESDYGKTWTKLLPESAYLFADDAEGEATPGKWTRTFPHALKGGGGAPDASFAQEWAASPFSDRFLGRLAERAIDAVALGQREGTDYLAVSFTALDAVGHDFGPRSQEVQDLLAHLDRTIGSLLSHLDSRVGRGRYVVAITGDHGVSPVPEQMAALGFDAARVSTPDLAARLEKALQPFLDGGKAIARVASGEVFFERGVADRLRASPDAMRAAVEAARAMPGIARVFTADQLASLAGRSSDEVASAAAAGFHPARSGDLLVIPRPYHQFAGSAAPAAGTGHGSPYWYDRRVPIVLLGAGIAAGVYSAPATPADIAPTLAYLAGITLPAADGRVLTEALAEPVTIQRAPRPPDGRPGG